MSKLGPIALLATLVTFSLVPAAVHAEEPAAATATAPVSVSAGRMIYGGNGQRIAPAYRVTSDGTVQVILSGKLVNIPASTLSEVNGKVSTTLTKSELLRAR